MNDNNTMASPPNRLAPLLASRSLRSPIGYPGSKAKAVKTIVNAMPTDWAEFREPFAGGLSLSLYLMQKYPERRFWVNDLDPFLSAFWLALVNEPERLVKTLSNYLAEFPSDRDKVFLAEWAKNLIGGTTGVERAALFYILGKTSFGSMAFIGTPSHPKKFNSRGVQHLEAVGQMLKGMNLKVTDLDYTDILTDSHDVFTYFDPPYVMNRYLYGENGNMHRNFDHGRFADAVNPLKSRWLVSYNNDLLVRHYFKHHQISTLQIQYTMSSVRIEEELLISNYNK